MSAFSFSDRVSIPDRLSLLVRLSPPERFWLSPIRVSPLVAENQLGRAYYQGLQVKAIQSTLKPPLPPIIE
jgi:hypothetical protein